jgi:hypothetical protein
MQPLIADFSTDAERCVFDGNIRSDGVELVDEFHIFQET